MLGVSARGWRQVEQSVKLALGMPGAANTRGRWCQWVMSKKRMEMRWGLVGGLMEAIGGLGE